LITILLAPYDDMGAFSGRIRVSVPRTSVGLATANSLALVLHELATNSLKYGALAAPSGLLDVSGLHEDPDLLLTWTERGGPEVEAPTGPAGYGTRLVARTISRQLGGVIDYDWSKDGLIVKMRMKKDDLAH
jgi:two-component sensor histidine kinase